jgi:hypothetical protein
MPEMEELGTSSRPLYTIGGLEAATWDAFADLVERNNGIYGGYWCIAYHVEYERRVSDPRTLKEQLVRAGRAHAALVFDDDRVAQGWCQYGSPEELDLRFRREYGKDPPPPARWARFRFSGTVELFEVLGFTRIRQVGKHAWIMNLMV